MGGCCWLERWVRPSCCTCNAHPAVLNMGQPVGRLATTACAPLDFRQARVGIRWCIDMSAWQATTDGTYLCRTKSNPSLHMRKQST